MATISVDRQHYR